MAQHFFLQPFLHFMALGQSFAIAAFFAEHAFLQFALYFASFRQPSFMAAFFAQQAFFAQHAFLQFALHFEAFEQSFFMAAILVQQGFLQFFLHFSCFPDMGAVLGATVCTTLSAFISLFVVTWSPVKPDTEKTITKTKMIPIIRFKINPPGQIIHG